MVLLVLIFLQPCINDRHCASDNFCTVDRCVANFCRHDYREGCCVNDLDCTSTDCHDTFCNVILNTCSARQKANGTSCSDGNACTVMDRCINGQCMGNTVTCNANPCSNGVCHKTQGCVYTQKEDDTPCDDGDSCTVNDKCWSGICVSGLGKDCSHEDDACNVGVCDADGTCTKMYKANGTSCTTTNMCEEQAFCTSGVCTGQRKTCHDNNPCTIDRCVDDVGCMIQYNFTSGTCLPGCTDNSACPTDYICHDGTCINIPADSGIDIRFLNYELEGCNTTHRRLLLSFALDTEVDYIDNTKYYRIVNASDDISALHQPLGFIDEVLQLVSSAMSNTTSRSAFTLTTACQAMDDTNCQTVFAGQTYDFDLELTHCEDVAGVHCIDANMHVQASVGVSIADCSMFDASQVVRAYGEGVLYYDGAKYLGNNLQVIGYEENRLQVGIETNVRNHSNFTANIYSMRVCAVDPFHAMANCVRNRNTSWCPQLGCYGWSAFDSPILLYYDIMQHGYFTNDAYGLAFNIQSCYPWDLYHASDAVKCAQPMCTWFDMDDGVSMTTHWTSNSIDYLHRQQYTGYNVEFVFDIVYQITGCFHHLRGSNEELHQLVSMQVEWV